MTESKTPEPCDLRGPLTMCRSAEWADRLAEAEAEIDVLRPFRDELLKIADRLGESDDPFAAWEALEAALTAAEARERKLREAPDGWKWKLVPNYPKGDVAGPCICGSWPGGKCLRCPPVLTPEEGQCIRAALTDTASAGDTEAAMQELADLGQECDAAPSAGDVRRRALEEAAQVVENMPVQIYRDEGIGSAGRSCKPASFEDAAEAIRALIATPATPTVEAGRVRDAARVLLDAMHSPPTEGDLTQWVRARDAMTEPLQSWRDFRYALTALSETAKEDA